VKEEHLNRRTLSALPGRETLFVEKIASDGFWSDGKFRVMSKGLGLG
jgi:hypothetical protein